MPGPDVVAGSLSFTRTPVYAAGVGGGDPGATPVERARAHLARHDDVYRTAGLELDSAGTARAGDTATVRFTQRRHGVPVLGSAYLVHERGDRVTSAAGDLFTGLTVSTEPAFTEEAAIALLPSVDTVHFREGTEKVAGHGLVVVPSAAGGALAYHLTVTGTTADGGPGRREVYLDAHHGVVVVGYDNLQADGPATGSGVDQHGASRPTPRSPRRRAPCSTG